MRNSLKVVIGATLCTFLLTSTSFVAGADARVGSFRSSGFRSTTRSISPKTTTPTKSVTPSKSTTSTKASTSTSSMKSRVTTPKTTVRPSSTTAKVTSPTGKTVNGTKFSKTGSVVDSTYRPKFSGGYTPPAGSVVYYRQNTWLDYLPLYFILFHGQHREAVVVEKGVNGAPDTEKVVKEEGVDTMYVINWAVTILFGLGLIALVYWLISRKKRNS